MEAATVVIDGNKTETRHIVVTTIVSRSIGDAYLKKVEFNREPLPQKFRLPETFIKLILSSESSVSIHKIQPEDKFRIFASDGLWEHLSNQATVNIVNLNPHNRY
ncbi:probable protein phosphatase 2C 38 [Vicia villosa]|uniref:probable protein phosphatase 2C 38 n=1 Tax=Vicia villosa TaxID=3911 RepID=UPI00273B6FD1|nr:probable protein phosphatase 2C 38 [Vicia villosa]